MEKGGHWPPPPLLTSRVGESRAFVNHFDLTNGLGTLVIKRPNNDNVRHDDTNPFFASLNGKYRVKSPQQYFTP